MRKLIVSPAPHVHGSESTRKIMLDVIIALAPSMLVAVYFFGLSAIQLLLVSVLVCVGLEYLIQKYLFRRQPTVSDLSAVVTGVLLALNLPPVAIGITKMTFGGLGHNIFNPALVGRVFLLVSFPVIMTDWTVPESIFRPGVDAVSGATPLAMVKEGLAQGQTVEQILAANPDLSYGQMLFARAGGSAGEASALALIIGFIYLLVRKVIRPHIPVTIILTVAVMSGIFWLINPEQYTDPLFNILTGGLLLGSIFMATDYVTSPMAPKGMVIYGIGIGVLTVLIRILIMNSIVPLLNKYIKPARFGKEVKHA